MSRGSQKKSVKRTHALGADAAEPEEDIKQSGLFEKRPDMTWRDHLIMLLYFGAEIEHSLMVQYLYAAYSIDGDQKERAVRERVEAWRASILSIAREEMGHLLTVQNVLTLLGAPANLYRRDFPWTTEFYPFPPQLEPFSELSLACYIYAEMPRQRHWKLAQAKGARGDEYGTRFGRIVEDRFQRCEEDDIVEIVDEVSTLVRGVDPDPHRVGALYHHIIELISDPELIPDSAFGEMTYDYQASWDEWGRGYKSDPYRLDPEGSRVKPSKKDAHAARPQASQRDAVVMIARMATRADAIKALRELSHQGEAPHLGEHQTGEPSHFDRFVEIFSGLRKTQAEVRDFKAARDIPVNPTTRNPTTAHPSGKPAMGDATSAVAKASDQLEETPSTYIEAHCARRFAELFNLRYRMLLSYLTHSFRLARTCPIDAPSRRAMVMHRVFGEMYNVKALADLLMRLPLRDDDDKQFAAPPFEMPYSLILPDGEQDVWRLHLALLEQAKALCEKILAEASNELEDDGKVFKKHFLLCDGKPYLETLIDLDSRAAAWITNILAA
jgi:hypothetical protein